MPLLQRIAAGWCVLVAILLTIVQFSVRTPPPLPLYVAFCAVWLFGAAMLFAHPTFGAVGTAAYGLLLGTQLVSMHGTTTLNLGLAVACFAGSGLAIAFLVQRRRSMKT